MGEEVEDFEGILGSVDRITSDLEDIKSWISSQKTNSKKAKTKAIADKLPNKDKEDPFDFGDDDTLVVIIDDDEEGEKSEDNDAESYGYVTIDEGRQTIYFEPDLNQGGSESNSKETANHSDHEDVVYENPGPDYQPNSKSSGQRKVVQNSSLKTYSRKAPSLTLQQLNEDQIENLKIPKAINMKEIFSRKLVVNLGKKCQAPHSSQNGVCQNEDPPPLLNINGVDMNDNSNLQNIQTGSLLRNDVERKYVDINFTIQEASESEPAESDHDNNNVSRPRNIPMGDSSEVEKLISKSDNNEFKNSNDILQKYKSRRICSFCSKTFKNLRELQTHLSRNHGEPLYKCTICKKDYNQKSNLRIHLRLHTGEKPYSCEFCSKKFSDPSSLYYHVKIHTEHRRYKCAICPKSFTQKGNLKTHYGTHIGRKPYACKVCGRKYSNPRYCKRHEEGHYRK